MREPQHLIDFDPVKEAVLQKKSTILARSYSHYTHGRVNEAEAKKFFDEILSTIKGAENSTDIDEVIKQLGLKKQSFEDKKLRDYFTKDLDHGLVQSYQGYTFPCDEMIILVIRDIGVMLKKDPHSTHYFYEGDKDYRCGPITLSGPWGQYCLEAAMLYGQCLAYKNGRNSIENKTGIKIPVEKYTDRKIDFFGATLNLKQPLTAFKKLLVEHKLVAAAKQHIDPMHITASQPMKHIDLMHITASQAITKISINVHEADAQGDTLAHHIAASDDINALQQLTARAVNFNVFNKLSYSPLHVAAPEAAKFLLKNGMLVDCANATRMTPLHYAAQQGKLELAKIFLAHGADLKAKDQNGRTVLHYADMSKSTNEIALVSLFLEAKVDPNVADKDGRAALHQVVAVEHYDDQLMKVVQLLVNAGATIGTRDKKGKTPLHLATERKHVDIVKFLLDRKADPQTVDEENQTALHLAVKASNRAITQLLLEAGANPNISDKEGKTALHFATDPHIVELLISKGADPNISAKNGDTPLKGAYHQWQTSNSSEFREIVKLLLMAKANPSACTEANPLAHFDLLPYAAMLGDVEIVKLLLESNINLEIKNNENNLTPLHFATIYGHAPVVQLLLNAGANLESRNNEDETPLHCAATKGHAKIVGLLLDKGANTETVNKAGKTPLNLASHTEVVKLLRATKSTVGTPMVVQKNVLSAADKTDLLLSFTLDYTELTFDKVLGKGGFGVVHLGVYRHNDVAIKQLHVTNPSQAALEEFQSEMAIMARLRCPQIVQLYGIYLQPSYGIVMEFLARGSLYKVLHNSEPLSWETRHQIAFDIACGLAFLHKENILHRDLKSLNVLLNDQMRAKLTDFGLAKIKNESSSVTGSQVVGTLQWMAPELFKRKAVYAKEADIYSFGITLWELVARKTPFEDAQNQALIKQWVLEGEREDIPEECPPKLARLIKFCWMQESTARPTADEAVMQLKAEEEQSMQLSYRDNLNSFS